MDSCHPSSRKPGFDPQASSSGICGGEKCRSDRPSQSTSVFSCIIPPMFRIYSLIFDRHDITGVSQRGSRKFVVKQYNIMIVQTQRVDHVGCFKIFSEEKRLMINCNKPTVFRRIKIRSHPIRNECFYLFTRDSNLSCLRSSLSESRLAGHPCYIIVANDTVVQETKNLALPRESYIEPNSIQGPLSDVLILYIFLGATCTELK